jgi:DNA-directed RNA polymerase specialized sigma24 family protein
MGLEDFMTADVPIQDLLHRAAARDPSAQEALVREFTPVIARAARRSLSRRVQSLCSVEDICQDVWAAFFTGSALHKPFTAPSALAAYLRHMAEGRAANANRRYLDCARRSLLRQAVSPAALDAVPDRSISPEALASFWDEWHHLLSSLPGLTAVIFCLEVPGLGVLDIATQLRLSTRLVRRHHHAWYTAVACLAC